MKLAYEAYDFAGRRVRDTVDAADSAEATESLRRRGLFVTSIQPTEGGQRQQSAAPSGAGGRGRMGTGRRLKNMTMFARQLYVLVSTGTPLVESLSAIERQTTDERWKEVVAAVRQRVEEGSSLAEALEGHRHCFDSITRSLVSAGESSGKLPVMLDRVAQLSRKHAVIRSNVIGAMVYPALLIVVAVAVLGVMLMFVLPRFAGLFEEMDVPLPATTQGLMLLSGLLRDYWWALLIGAAAAGVGGWFGVHSEAGRRVIDTVVLRVPKFGRIVQSFATARIARLMGILIDSYLPLLEVLELVRASTTNHHYRKLLERAEDAVTRGEGLSGAFNDPSLISPSVYEAMRSGEDSGQLGQLMLNMADFLDEDNEVTIKSLTSIIEPIILLILGALVGFVAVSMFLPLFDLTAMVGR